MKDIVQKMAVKPPLEHQARGLVPQRIYDSLNNKHVHITTLHHWHELQT